MSLTRMPVVFLNHGSPMVLMDANHPLRAFYMALSMALPRPTAIVMVSAHWEEKIPTVTSWHSQELVYDFYGFPDELYTLKYPAPGRPTLATRIQNLLTDRGLKSQTSTRGLDHGAFTPLMSMYPEADVPVVSVSLLSSLDPSEHVALGRALSPLRDEGVLILCGGAATHNLRLLFSYDKSGDPTVPVPWAKEFIAGVNRVVLESPANKRHETITSLPSLPHFDTAHPRSEHIAPLYVAVGASLETDEVQKVNDVFEMKCFAGVSYIFGSSESPQSAARTEL
eukprot:GILJ01004025.1.p1 GENE.GILJ01004025.1~~GILJ01004025.1.p1  ORF type:complete len:282 (-),score=26.61 GILJ01004025.1:279-1124(-)